MDTFFIRIFIINSFVINMCRTDRGQITYNNIIIDYLFLRSLSMDLKKLPTDEKIKFILEQQQNGLSRKEISDLFQYSKISRLDDFMKRNGYIKQNDKFILGGQMEDKSNMEDIEPIFGGQVVMPKDSQSKMLNIINQADTLQSMIQWFKTNIEGVEGHLSTRQAETIIEVNTGLQINHTKSMAIKTTVRVDKDIWEDFGKLCTGKYSHLSKIDILSQCIFEFVEKYK